MYMCHMIVYMYMYRLCLIQINFTIKCVFLCKKSCVKCSADNTHYFNDYFQGVGPRLLVAVMLLCMETLVLALLVPVL